MWRKARQMSKIALKPVIRLSNWIPFLFTKGLIYKQLLYYFYLVHQIYNTKQVNILSYSYMSLEL